jgi:hypothetical protein
VDPYIGITGVMTPQEVRALHRVFQNTFVGTGLRHKLVIGILASSKTLAGIQNKYPNRYPKPNRIPEIAQNLKDVFNVIHYSVDDDELDSLGFQLTTISNEIGGPHIDGIQLNVVWPHNDALKSFHIATRRTYKIILQLSRYAMGQMHHDVNAIAERVASYGNLIDAVLIDQSGGMGITVDVPHTLDLLDALAKRTPYINLGVAGGLTAGTLSNSITPLINHHPNLSWDTESGVRVPKCDDLDLQACYRYLVTSRTLHFHNPLKQFAQNA